MAKEGRVGLGIWDRLVLFMAWVVTCGLVYVLGFYVGKGTQEQRLGLEERIVRLPVTSKPPAEGQRPKAESELTFYDTLGSRERDDGTPERSPAAAGPSGAPHAAPSAAPPTAAQPAGPPPTAPHAAAAPVVSPPAPRVAAAQPATPSPPAVRPAVATVAAAPGATPAPPHVAASVAHDVPPTPAPSPAAHPAPPPTTLAAVPPAHPVAPVAPVPAGHAFTVQANPTRNRDEVDALYRQLRGRGYDASIVRVLRDGETWYRVQVGRFATSEQATQTMQRLRDHEGVPHVFVASE